MIVSQTKKPLPASGVPVPNISNSVPGPNMSDLTIGRRVMCFRTDVFVEKLSH